jgi:hypothetical protein
MRLITAVAEERPAAAVVGSLITAGTEEPGFSRRVKSAFPGELSTDSFVPLK